MNDESTRFRREDDRQRAEILATLRHIKEQTDANSTVLMEIREGTRIFPQCKDHDRRITSLEGNHKADAGFKNSLKLSGFGAAIALAVKHVWEKLAG